MFTFGHAGAQASCNERKSHECSFVAYGLTVHSTSHDALTRWGCVGSGSTMFTWRDARLRVGDQTICGISAEEARSRSDVVCCACSEDT